MKINLTSFNPLAADVQGNKEKVAALLKAPAPKADLLVLPEAALCGCPLFDLYDHPELLKQNQAAVKELAKLTKETACVLGYLDKQGKDVTTCAAFIYKGKITKIFDTQTLDFKGKTLQIVLGGLQDVPALDADIVVHLYAKPYAKGNIQTRLDELKKFAKKYGAPVLSCNLLGGGDGMIFDGLCAAADKQGKLSLLGELFREGVNTWDSEEKYPSLTYQADVRGEVLDALSFGLGDFVQKSGYDKVILGISGGLDSAITAVLAAAALGGESVFAVSLPSYCTSDLSKTLAGQLARNLGINLEEVGVKPVMEGLKTAISHITTHFKDRTDQELQSRLRSTLLMTLGREYRALVLSTDDLSELASGSCILYGDTCGRLLPLGDIYKSELYDLASYINKNREIIPQGIIDRAPTSELRPNQKDEDILPPYKVLDKILSAFLTRQLPPAEIAKQYKIKLETVVDVCRRVSRSDFKRRQLAPILKINERSFGDVERPVIKKINL